MPKLTKRSIDAIKPSPTGGDKVYWDDGSGSVTGFGVRVKGKSGVMSYLIQYRNAEGRSRRLTLGKVGTLTPEQARALAIEKLAEVSKGADPVAERTQLRSSMTVKELCLLYLEQSKGHVRDSTLRQDKSRIESHVIPLLGSRAVGGISSDDIRKMQSDIAAGKTAAKHRPEGRGGVRQGGKGVAGRTLGMMHIILEFAKKELKIIKENPATGIRKLAEKRAARHLDENELAAFGKAMSELEAEGYNKTGLDAIRALLLTGCRREEILSLPWSWVKLKGRFMRLEHTKTDAQFRPLGSAAIRLLQSRPQRGKNGNELTYVFTSGENGHYLVGIRKIFLRVCERAGIKDFRIHDLRHTFAGVGAGLNISSLVIAAVIGHKVKGITADYATPPDAATLAAADLISERMDALLRGENACAEIINFRGAM